MREKIIALLKEVEPDIDYENTRGLLSDKLIDSIDMMQIIAELEDTFDIEIGMEYLDNTHFDSVDAIEQVIRELQG